MAAAAAAAAAPGPGEGPAVPPAQPLELKSQFRTREGSYRLLGPEPRPRAGPAAAAAAAAAAPGPSPPAAAAAPGPATLPPVRLSMVRLALPPAEEPGGGPAERSRVCFNLGRELYFYGGAGAGGRGNRRSLDLHKPIDKRIYKGTQPTCHDFNQFTAAADTIALLVGFSAGQVQCLDLVKKDSSKLFNEERLIDKTKVTFVKWLPGTERLFLASHASGHLYLYDAEQPCGAAAPQYSLLTQGDGFSVFSCKSKAPRNPLLKWAVGEGALNEFAFSPDGRSLACVSQDGCLRVFHFDSMLLQGMMKSYFGGLLCVCWSPDGRYVVTGGEDDLVTVWSFAEGRVVARGHGHKSWVNAVAFDPFTGAAQSPEHSGDEEDGDDDEEEERRHEEEEQEEEPPDPLVRRSPAVTYRFGSAGQDTQFCLWDLTEDILYPRPPLARTRTLPGDPGGSACPVAGDPGSARAPAGDPCAARPLPRDPGGAPGLPRSLSRSNSLPQSTGLGRCGRSGTQPAPSAGRFATLTLQERRGPGDRAEQQRYHSLGNVSRGGERPPQPPGPARLDPAKALGTALCPRIHEVPLLEPLVCKKIAHERLTVLLFLEDCIVTACQEGLICTWARPGKAGLSPQNGGSPRGTVV